MSYEHKATARRNIFMGGGETGKFFSALTVGSRPGEDDMKKSFQASTFPSVENLHDPLSLSL